MMLCDLSGRTCYAEDMRRMWNGLMVHKDYWEPRNPQDFIYAIRDQVAPAVVRPDTDGTVWLPTNTPTVVPTYKLDDDGANAATFGVVHLPTIPTAYTRATYELTATSQTLAALPASVTAAPGLVTLVEGVPLVCGFKIHSLPSAGDIDATRFFQIYNYGGSGSVLFNAYVTKDTGATTGTIHGEFGTFPPSTANFGSAYTGELAGVKIAFQLTLSGGSLSADLFVNGTLLGTSTPIATDGGVFADMQIADGVGTGVIDISCVPDAASLAVGYGTFDAGAVDMVGTSL